MGGTALSIFLGDNKDSAPQSCGGLAVLALTLLSYRQRSVSWSVSADLKMRADRRER